MYTQNFKLFLYSVYPVAMTKVSSFFYAHNSLDIYQIHTKLGMRMYLYTLFTCAKYRYNGVTSLCFIAIFAKYVKRNRSPRSPLQRKKNKRRNQNKTSATYISETAREISFKFGM